MKNVFIIAALALSFSMNATVSTWNVFEGVALHQDKEYKKIDESKVPAEVLREVSTKYEGYKTTDAAVSVDSEYRITVSKDSKIVKIYFTSTGEFVREEK
jgi:hypothetical protein